MKNLKLVLTGFLAAVVFLLTVRAGDTNSISSTTSTNSVKPDLLKTCPVSGEKLGEMAPPTVIIYKGQEVKLCCPDCKKDFDKDPEKYIKMIRAADKPKN